MQLFNTLDIYKISATWYLTKFTKFFFNGSIGNFSSSTYLGLVVQRCWHKPTIPLQVWRMLVFKKKFDLLSCPRIIAFTSAGAGMMTWSVNSICSNKTADVNFEIGINLVRKFGPPLRHINIRSSTVWTGTDGLSTENDKLIFYSSHTVLSCWFL